MIRIGTSGFSFPEWRGNAYPKYLKLVDMLDYYQNGFGFDTVELNFTFYSFPRLKTMERLALRTQDGFQFLVKANQFMTHDLHRSRLLTDNCNPQLHRMFVDNLRPLIEHRKLGCVLFQFPRYFEYSSKSMDYLWGSKQSMGNIPMAVEFRSSSWNRVETFHFLEESNIVFCAADQYQDKGTMPFVCKVTSRDAAYFRFHGRGDSWIDETTNLRYQHLYSQLDLSGFRDAILHVAQNTRTTYIFFNNCHAGAAARNARQLKKMLGVTNSENGMTVDLFDSCLKRLS